MTVANGPDRTGAARGIIDRCAGSAVATFAALARPPRIHARDAWPWTPRQLAIAAGLGAALFLLLMFTIDGEAIRAVAHLPRWIVWCFNQITDFGKSGWFLWPLGVLFLTLAALPSLPRVPQLVLTAIMVRVGFLFAAIAVPGIVVNVVKHIFGRARPGVGGSIDPTLFSPFSWPAAYAGLPSGHAATAFSVLVAFGTLWPRQRALLWLYAVLIALSRVAVTAHYPSDVLAGAAVGYCGALFVRRWFALRGLGFSVAPDGVLRQKPGPSLRRIKAVARALLA